MHEHDACSPTDRALGSVPGNWVRAQHKQFVSNLFIDLIFSNIRVGCTVTNISKHSIPVVLENFLCSEIPGSHCGENVRVWWSPPT